VGGWGLGLAVELLHDVTQLHIGYQTTEGVTLWVQLTALTTSRLDTHVGHGGGFNSGSYYGFQGIKYVRP
jgi:hypothetical protein